MSDKITHMSLRKLVNALEKKSDFSDIHIKIGDSDINFIRTSQGLVSIPSVSIPLEKLYEDAEELHFHNDLQELVEGKIKSFDFAIQTEGSRYRAHAYKALGGVRINLRLIPKSIPSIKDIKLPVQALELVTRESGLGLICGATGSGKTTTITSQLEYVNKTQSKTILTLEDPIEFVFKPDKCVIEQREVGEHITSYPEGLRDALREDPEIIMLGEMRDIESISTAITASETGHLVISTLHTKDCIGAIERIVDVFPPEQQQQIRIQLAQVLNVIVHQTLIRSGGKVHVMHEVLYVDNIVRNAIKSGKLTSLKDRMRPDPNSLSVVESAVRLVKEEGLDINILQSYLSDDDFNLTTQILRNT